MTNNKNDQTIILIDAADLLEPTIAMRTDLDTEGIKELAENIRKIGLINPLTVRPIGEKYEIVAGHRRYRACLIATKTKIPCYIKELTDDEVYAIRAGENLFRSAVNPVDEAIFLGKLVGDDDSKIDEVARLVDRSAQWVYDRLQILHYPDYFLPALSEGKITLGVARNLARIEDDIYRQMFFNTAIQDGMKTWQAEYYLAQYQAGIFKRGEEIIVPEDFINPNAPPTIRQRCEKCGGMAEAPNLTNVFVHITCPEE